ncbi:hypothetical protein M2323_004702, partial [Rhodoblastus acidophilus]|nr:hypothetical protein [Rhodoblastus acidophilus]
DYAIREWEVWCIGGVTLRDYIGDLHTFIGEVHTLVPEFLSYTFL